MNKETVTQKKKKTVAIGEDWRHGMISTDHVHNQHARVDESLGRDDRVTFQCRQKLRHLEQRIQSRTPASNAAHQRMCV